MFTRSLIATAAVALAATAAFAQQTTAPANDAKTMNMHDHGAERGTPMAPSHMAKASAARKGASAPKRHDHGKEKNN